MAGVAIDGSQIQESIISDYVTYDVEHWEQVGTSPGWTDEDGIYHPGEPIYDWVPYPPGSTGAKITGSVVVSSSKMKLTGTNIATVDDITQETWTAYPIVPPSVYPYRYTPTTLTSGSGQGKIVSGSSKAKLKEKAIALIGSQVTTCLGTTTTIQTGNTKMQISG